MLRAVDDPDALVGAVLNGSYRLTGLIGTGGLGFVYRGHALLRDEPVAIKVLKNEFRADPQVVERFLSEMDVGRRLEHPGIVRILDGRKAEDGSPYIVMELLMGHALSVEMRRGHLPARRSVSIVERMLRALSFAHEQGVIHRDLKPDNVFIVPNASGDDQVKLLDFGIARVMDSAGGATRKTQTGMLLGTAGYMSPEQVKNSKDADARSDLWAVGVLLYEMLTGRRAFEADNEFVRATAVLYQDVVPIETIAPQFSHWSGFFEKALVRDPAQRFKDAEEMRLSLTQVASGALLSSGSMGSTQRLPDPAVAPAPLEYDTRVSPRGEQAGVEPAVDVQVVSTKPRGVPAAVVLALTVAALLLGYLLGATVSG